MQMAMAMSMATETSTVVVECFIIQQEALAWGRHYKIMTKVAELFLDISMMLDSVIIEMRLTKDVK